MDYKEKQKMYKNLYKSSGKTIWISKIGKNQRGQTYKTPVELKSVEQKERELNK